MKQGFVKALLLLAAAALFCGCGILPKINTDPANRTKEETTAPASSVSDPSGSADPTDPSETEEALDPFEEQRRDMIALQKLLFRFYEEAYDQYVNLQDIDLSDMLDLSFEECENIQQELQQAVEKKREAVKAGTAEMPEKLPYEMIVSGPGYGGGSGDNDRFGFFLFLLKPLAEKGDLSDEEYLSQYPPFMKFGLNEIVMFKYKRDGKWSDFKIETFYDPEYSIHGMDNAYEKVVRAFYDAAWTQYTALEYTGLQDVMDEASPDYQEAEALLKQSIEDRKARPGSDMPEGLDYRFRIIDVTMDPPVFNWERIGTVRFELIPDPDLKEGETFEEKLKEYPAFMEFGEHCWSIHMEQGDILREEGQPDKYLRILTAEELHAAEAPGAAEYSLAEEEMEVTIRTFFRTAYISYLLTEDADLSDVLDMSKEECVRAEKFLQDAIEKRRAEKAGGTDDTTKEETRKATEGGDPYPKDMNPWWTEPLNSFYEAAGSYEKTDDPRHCRGYVRFDLHMYTKEAQEAYAEMEREYYEKGIMDQLPPPVYFTDEECRGYFKDFLPFMGAENAFSFNWDDGTCKIDGFDAREKFEGE